MRRDNEFLYTRLAHILREQILTGFIKPGQFLLSENELCKYYKLSRTSVRKSLDQLVKEGLVVKKAGQGNLVPHDLLLEPMHQKVLHIFAPSPSYFVEYALPVVLDLFRERYPHVEVKILSLPAINFWESLRTSREMGLHPDLVFITDTQFYEMEDHDEYSDIRTLLPSELSDVYPRLLEPFVRGGQLKAVPITFSTVYMAYNQELFDKQGVPLPSKGWTLQDFIHASQALTVDSNGDGITDQFGFSLSSHFSRWPVFALQNGMKQSREPDGVIIRRTLRLMHELLHRKRAATVYHSTPNRFRSNPFVHGKSAMVLTTTFESSAWKEAELCFTPRIAPLALGDANSTLLLSNIMLVPESGGDHELTHAFLQTALSPEVQGHLSEATLFLSVLRGINESTRSASFLESINVAGDSMNRNYFVNELFDIPGLLEELEPEMELFWLGLESDESFAAKWESLITAGEME